MDKHNSSKILFIMHMPPPVHGASMVGEYIHKNRLINETFECHYVNMAIASKLEDIRKKGPDKIWAVIKKMWQIRKAVKEVKADLVYITPCSAGLPFYKDFFTIMMLKMMGQKVVMHFHNKGVQSRQNCWFDNFLYKRYFRDARLILLAKSLYDDVRRYVRREDVFVCPNAIPDIAQERGRKDSDGIPRILWLTNIMKTKGIMEYLRALKMLRERGVRFEADFVGGLTKEMSGEEFDKALTSMGLNGCSVYHGPKYGDAKYEYFQNADVFVLPSYTEALPVSVLEAMQFGVPVVASNVGGVSEEIEDGVNGFLIGGDTPIMLNSFRPDAVEIADRLERLLTDAPLRKRMGDNGRKKFEREFVLDVFEQRLCEILRKCLNYEN